MEFDETRPCIMHIIPRDVSKPPQQIELPSHFTFHFANAYEEDEKLIVGRLPLSRLRYD